MAAAAGLCVMPLFDPDNADAGCRRIELNLKLKEAW